MAGDVVEEIVDAVLGNLVRPAPDDWQSFSLIVKTEGRRINGTYGYFYDPSGESFPNATQPANIREAATAYVDSHYGPGEEWPVRFLLQVDRDLGVFEVTFEDTDSSRWAPNPADPKSVADAVRPNFSHEPAADLIWSIVEHLAKPPPDDWVALATVLILRNRSVSGSYGYLYLPDGGIASGTPHADEVEPEVEAYLADHFGPQDPWPVKLLVQFDRTMGRFLVTFEDTDESRWFTSLDRIQELQAELRPDFSDDE